MIYLTFLAAFMLSGIAAYYSVLGLTSIFTGAFWSVVIMGSALEFSKLVTASWLYRNWKTAPFLLKSYLTIAVLLLMLITSMGIFGFLSKSHIDSTLNAGTNTVELKTLTEQEKNVKDRLNYLLARAKDPSTASRKLDRQIQETQKDLSDINAKKLPLLKENTKLTADIGPIKYVADMFYGADDNGVDKAVRMVIMIIMLVFDPLAVLLLVAGNISLQRKEDGRNKNKDVEWSDWNKNVMDAPLATKSKKTKKTKKYETTPLEPLDRQSDSSVIIQSENIANLEDPIPAKIIETHQRPGFYTTEIK
jgi:hypothetical protein